LIYNRARIKTIDKVVFPEHVVRTQEFLLYRKGFPFREADINIDDLPNNEVKRFMQDWYQWTQEEFILDFKVPCWIEPDFGWAIVGSHYLMYYSLGVSRTLFQPKPRLINFLRRKETSNLSKAISLRDTGEENYFHFYNDVISKLYFLQLNGIDIKSLPIIISAKLWNKPYFQHWLESVTDLRLLNWVVQGSQYIRCENTIFCKPLTHRRDLWSMVLSPLQAVSKSSMVKKIFLVRNKQRLRFIENEGEIKDICERHGYTIVDADALTLGQQIEIFSQASTIVGIHGAGLTNMAYANGCCKVLELFPPPELNYLPYHYIMLAKIKGFTYRAIIGKPGETKYSGGFKVESNKFLESLKEFDL